MYQKNLYEHSKNIERICEIVKFYKLYRANYDFAI